jgi:hypothetical protein
VCGIKWREEFEDVRLDIGNKEVVALYNIDLEIEVDVSIAGVGQLTNIEMHSFPEHSITAEGNNIQRGSRQSRARRTRSWNRCNRSRRSGWR